MTENEIGKQILDASFVVHSKLGPGLLESVYEVILSYELQKGGNCGAPKADADCVR
jgi:GxxExxY protein